MLLRRYHDRRDSMAVTRKVHKVEETKEIPKRDVALEEKTVSELKEKAKDVGIKGYSNMNKKELIEALAGD